MVPGEFYRKLWFEGRFGFVVIGFLLSFASALVFVDNNTNERGVGIGDVGGRENFWKTSSLVVEDSDSLPEKSYDCFQTKIRPLRGIPETVSTTSRDRVGTSTKLTQRPYMHFAAGDVERKKFYNSEDLSDGEWGKDREFLERGKSLRKLQNDANETGKDTGMSNNTTIPVTANTTTIEDDQKVEMSRIVIGVTIALGTAAFLLSILSWIFVYLNRNNRIVAIGQPPFLYLICFGSMLMSSELFLLFRYGITDQSTRNTSCIVQMWCRNIGSVCVHMAIFCKLWRAYKVSQFRKNQIVLPKHVIGPFVAMLATVIAVTIAQTILDPPVWHVKNVQALNNVGLCMPPSIIPSGMKSGEMSGSIDGNDIWIEITMGVLTFFCLAIMLYMAYITRNIPEDISDSRHVFRAVFYGILLSATMYGLFWVGVWVNSYGLSAFAWSLRYFFDAIIFLGYLVIPKIYGVWQQNKQSVEVSHERLPNATTRTISNLTPPNSIGKGKVHVSGLH